MRYLGMCLILGMFFCLHYSYVTYLRRRREALAALLRLATAVLEELSTYGRPLRQLAAGMEDPYLREQGILARLAAGEPAAQALSFLTDTVAGEAGRQARSYFTAFGRSYREEERAKAELLCRELEQALRARTEEDGRSERVFFTVGASLAVGLVILLL